MRLGDLQTDLEQYPPEFIVELDVEGEGLDVYDELGVLQANVPIPHSGGVWPHGEAT